MKRIIASMLLLLLMGMSCKKNKQTEEEKLPPITQTGANTFGCLVNGNAWLPEGYQNPTPNYRVNIDPTFYEGSVLIRVFRKTNAIREDMGFTSDSIKAIGTYQIRDGGRTLNRFQKSAADLSNQVCDVDYQGSYQRQGFIKITRYDLTNGIISGEFEVSMVNPNCGYGDTIKITKGRFDKKL